MMFSYEGKAEGVFITIQKLHITVYHPQHHPNNHFSQLMREKR